MFICLLATSCTLQQRRYRSTRRYACGLRPAQVTIYIWWRVRISHKQNFSWRHIRGFVGTLHVWVCPRSIHRVTNTHTHPFNGPLSRTTRVNQYQKGKTNLDFTETRDSEWQWHQLGHMQVCTSLQTDNHASTPPLSFLQAGCPSCHPTNSVKALKAEGEKVWKSINIWWSYAQEFGVLFFWLSVVYV